MFPAIRALRVGKEITIYRSADGIERRVRRVKHALYQVFDICWAHRQCWHLSLELSPNLAWKVAQYSDCVFRARGAFAVVQKAPRASGYQSKQNILLKQRIFHDARRRSNATEKPRLVVINGGRCA